MGIVGGRAGLACLAGPAAVVGGWLVIGLSWALNRDWFVFTRDAFSDFGGPESCCPALYNVGLMLVGLLVAVYGLCTIQLARGKAETVGGAYMILAGVFLALIGLFPSGHRHHVFVSTWFFVQADLALVPLLAGLRGRCKHPLLSLALWASILAFPVAGIVEALVGWPSAAVIEAYGVVVIDLGVIAAYLCQAGLLHAALEAEH